MKKFLLMLFVLMTGIAYAEQALLYHSCATVDNAELVHSFPLAYADPNDVYREIDGGIFKGDGYVVRYFVYYGRAGLAWSDLQKLKESGEMEKLVEKGTLLDRSPVMIAKHNFELNGAIIIDAERGFPGGRFNLQVGKGKPSFDTGDTLTFHNTCRIIGVNSGGNIFHLGFQVNEKTADIYEFR